MALTAVPVGFVAGLFGIGGGLITVPFLYFIFSSLSIEQQYLMHLAVGTSFAIIIPTSTVSVLTHHKFKAVDFDIVKSYGIFVITGVVIGTMFAASMKTKSLVLFFLHRHHEHTCFHLNIFSNNSHLFDHETNLMYVSLSD